MIELYHQKSQCTGCQSCANACPSGAITMVADREGFLYPTIDGNRCTECGLCQKVCHKEIKKQENPQAYGAYCKDLNLRLKSSSGGLFSVFADKILQMNGVVVGAAMADDFKSVEHRFADNQEELKKLRGSKYVQSNTGTSYSQVEQLLKQGKIVYFSGTPCQIEGLYRYLRKDYENLYTQDLICHGAPSPLAWRKYAQEQEISRKAPIREVSFRNKSYGWKRFAMRIDFDAEIPHHCEELAEDPYLRGFMSDNFLRPSCYACQYKTKLRSADITLADFWGAGEICPELDDDKGLSLVIVHSPKGKALLESVQEKIVRKSVDLDEAVRYNPAMIRSSGAGKNRAGFMKDLPDASYQKLFKKYVEVPNWVRFKSRIKGIVKKAIRR